MTASVSVVIPMRNAASTIGAQLQALAHQTYAEPFEIIVADNGSSDASPQVVDGWRDRLPGLSLVRAVTDYSAAAARNAGLRAASGELLLNCDADDVVSPGWIEAMAAAEAGSAILGGPLDTALLNTPDVLAWRGDDYTDAPPQSFGRPYFLTSNMGFAASTFQTLGGFRESFDRGGADVDFCLRAHAAGIDVRFVPDAIVHYRHRDSVRSFVRQFYNYGRSSSRLRRAHTTTVADGRPPKAAQSVARRLVGTAVGSVSSRTQRARLAGQVAYLAGRVVGRAEPWSPEGPTR